MRRPACATVVSAMFLNSARDVNMEANIQRTEGYFV